MAKAHTMPIPIATTGQWALTQHCPNPFSERPLVGCLALLLRQGCTQHNLASNWVDFNGLGLPIYLLSPPSAGDEPLHLAVIFEGLGVCRSGWKELSYQCKEFSLRHLIFL